MRATRPLVSVDAVHEGLDRFQDERIGRERRERLRELHRLAGWAEQIVMADTLEAHRKHMQQKAHATLYRSTELIAQNWFGPGAPHPRLAERVGNYTLVMKDNCTVKDWLPGEKRHVHIGVHGGISDDEMYVPLITLAA